MPKIIACMFLAERGCNTVIGLCCQPACGLFYSVSSKSGILSLDFPPPSIRENQNKTAAEPSTDGLGKSSM